MSTTIQSTPTKTAIIDETSSEMDSKKEDAENALRVFRAAFVGDPENFNTFRKDLMSDDFTGSSYEGSDGRFNMEINYENDRNLNLEIIPKEGTIAMRSKPGTSTQSRDPLKGVFKRQLEQALKPEFADWVIGNVFSANFTQLEWATDYENNLYQFTVYLDQKKSGPFTVSSQENNILLQTFLGSVAPDLNIRIGRIVTGVIRPDQKTVIFSDGVNLEGGQQGVAPGIMNAPKRMLYKATHSLADRYIPASLKAGFNDWANSDYQQELLMEASSIGFVQRTAGDGHERVSIGIIEGSMQYGEQYHELKKKWISPSVKPTTIMNNLKLQNA